MAIDPELRTKVEAELRMGEKPKKLAEKYGISYPTVAVWRKKIEKERADQDVDAVTGVPAETLHMVAEKIKAEAPTQIAKEVEKLEKSVNGLERLNEKMQEVAFKILTKVDQALAEDLGPRDLSTLAGIIKDLYMAFNNKNVTNVNVLNQTSISTEKREIFQSSLKA